MKQKITIVGAGAIGGLVAGRLAKAGNAVNVVARGGQLSAIRHKGLTVIDGEATFSVAVNVTDMPAELGVQDLVCICLKGQALLEGASALKPLIGPDTHILSVMNGIPWWFLHEFGGAFAGQLLTSVDPGHALSRLLPAAQTSGCVVHLSAAIVESGTVRRMSGNKLVIGAAASAMSDACEKLAQLLSAAGFEASHSGEIRSDIWLKLWGNMTMNPISALTRSTTDLILQDPHTEQLAVSIMEEARKIGERYGITVDISSQQRNAITRKFGAMTTSMLQDVQSGRSLEVEALLGAPLELARIAGLEMPWISALYGLTRQLDRNLAMQRTGR